MCVYLVLSSCFSYLPLFSDPPSGLAILFKELYTQEPVNPFSLDVEIFQEPLVDIESRYTIRGFEGKGREPEYSEESLAVRPSRMITLLAAPSRVNPPARVLAPAKATQALTLLPVNPAACIALM